MRTGRYNLVGGLQRPPPGCGSKGHRPVRLELGVNILARHSASHHAANELMPGPQSDGAISDSSSSLKPTLPARGVGLVTYEREDLRWGPVDHDALLNVDHRPPSKTDTVRLSHTLV